MRSNVIKANYTPRNMQKIIIIVVN